MPSPITFPLSPWVRAGIWAYVLGYAVGKELLDELDESVGDDLEWRRLHVRFSQDESGAPPDDDAFCTFDIQNWTGGAPDPTWTTADYLAVEALFTTFFGVWSGFAINEYKVTEYRWYKQRFVPHPGGDPFDPPWPLLDSGGPERITAKSIPGISTGAHAHQIAFSVTEKTAWAGHWGRFYLPAVQGVGGDGRWADSVQLDIQNAAAALYSALADSDFMPVVPIRQVKKKAEAGLLQVTAIQTDDIPDVIRRRRPRTVARRYITPTGA